MISLTTEKNQPSYSSDILRVLKYSHFLEAKKGVIIWVSVTIRGMTISRQYTMLISRRDLKPTICEL